MFATRVKKFAEQMKLEGRQAGREEGEYKKAIEAARNFKSMGLDDEMIAKGVGLPVDVIRSIL